MSWWIWGLIAAYGTGLINTWRKVAYNIATEFHTDWDDVIAGFFFGFFPSVVWPLVELWFWLKGRSKSKGWSAREFVERVGKMPREQRNAAKERDLREREQRIRRMEDELGIKRDEEPRPNSFSRFDWIGGR